jgi:hypothetical protein
MTPRVLVAFPPNRDKPGTSLEGGRGFPVAKRAAADANRGGGLLLGHPLGEQLRRPLLLCGYVP